MAKATPKDQAEQAPMSQAEREFWVLEQEYSARAAEFEDLTKRRQEVMHLLGAEKSAEKKNAVRSPDGVIYEIRKMYPDAKPGAKTPEEKGEPRFSLSKARTLRV